MYKIALISDIHANFEALQSILADIEKTGIRDVISLGDNVGYGPNPVEVLKELHQRDIFSLEGNHDLAVVNPKAFYDATDLALDAIEWTRKQLMHTIRKQASFEEILKSYLGSRAFILVPDHENVILVHGCPGEEEARFDYMITPQDFLKPSQFMARKELNVCIFGHTHRQGLWEVDEGGVSFIDFDIDEPVTFTGRELRHVRLFVNPGSVGQPRDKNPDAAYMIYEIKKECHSFTFKRVPYEIEKTRRKIYAVNALDRRLGDRLVIGS